MCKAVCVLRCRRSSHTLPPPSVPTGSLMKSPRPQLASVALLISASALVSTPTAAFVAPLGRTMLRTARRPATAACPVSRPYGSKATRPTMSGGSTDETSVFDKIVVGARANIAPGNPDDMPPSPSGVNELAKPLQAAVVAAIFAGIALGTYAVTLAYSALDLYQSVGYGTSVLGGIFVAAGVSHFTLHKDFCRMYPGRGAWGFWYLPGSASFHVNWTGVAEIAGGAGLAAASFGLGPADLGQASALGLFALTWAVTPANVYMYTHGAQFPEGVEVPVAGHAVRLAVQSVLLSVFWQLAH